MFYNYNVNLFTLEEKLIFVRQVTSLGEHGELCFNEMAVVSVCE